VRICSNRCALLFRHALCLIRNEAAILLEGSAESLNGFEQLARGLVVALECCRSLDVPNTRGTEWFCVWNRGAGFDGFFALSLLEVSKGFFANRYRALV
jgi:hypothetical protein